MTDSILTDFGTIGLEPLSTSTLKELQERLPYGFMGPFKEEFNGARYGFVVRCGDKELPCLKQQPVDCDKDRAMMMVNLHFVLILNTISRMSKDSMDVLYYATPYLKDKGDGKWESGIVHFIFPGEENAPDTPVVKAYDSLFGEGATAYLDRFMKYFNENFDDKFRMQYIGLDIRTRSQIGNLVSGFMLWRDSIIFTGTLREDDPRFNVLAKNGVTNMFLAPSLPMTISPSQLEDAKGLTIMG